jgi:hypothetical protein
MQHLRTHIEFTLKPAMTAPASYWLVIGRGECGFREFLQM